MSRRATRAAAKARAEVGPPFAGVDEAGRGPVLGPLVVAGVRVDDESWLRRLGVKDSKRLTPLARELILPKIESRARIAVRMITHDELNARMGDETLNEIEVSAFADILRELEPKCAFVDAADVVAERFGTLVSARLTQSCHVVSEHKADDRYPCVAAASIVAKVLRDREIGRLEAAYGVDVGSGYSHDVRTRQFLREWVKEHGALPPFARVHWETSRAALNRTLDDFIAPGGPRA